LFSLSLLPRYVLENAYYKTKQNVWVYAQVLYDTQLDIYVNPDGSECSRVAEFVPYGELIMNGANSKEDKPEPMKLPQDVLELINNEYDFYQQHLNEYLKS
jgi:hypothetical protein